MGLTTLSAQLVSLLRAKLRKLVKKYKKNIVLTFGLFFPAWCLSNQLNFSVVVFIYEIPVFDEAFSFLATVAMITPKVSFSCSHGNHF